MCRRVRALSRRRRQTIARIGLLMMWLGVPDIWVLASFVLTGVAYLLVIQSIWRRGHFLGRALQEVGASH